VACNWRIRHKLMLGMGLVMAIMGLLLAGTLKGLASYSATMRTIDSKIVELNAAEDLRATIKEIDSEAKTPELPDKARLAEKALEDYHGKLRASVERSRDPYQGFKETEQVEALQEGFRKLNSALKQELSAQVFSGGEYFQPAQATRLAAGELSANSTGLHILIDEDVHDRIRVSQAEKNVIFRIVVSTSVLAVLLMVGLLWIFNRSVAHPIRDLERGVGRVAKGDFDYRIEVHSGDEIEDLAQAFNDMTARLRDMYRDLAQQVNERSRQLIRSERLAGVGFLAAGVAHEINNPLASIAFCGEALERRLADLFESRRTGAGAAGDAQEREIVSKYLKMIQDEAFRCKTITRKLLEFSRGGERRREQTDLSELIQVVLDMVQHLPSAKGKQVDLSPPRKSPSGSTARRFSRSSSTWWSMRWKAWTKAASSRSASGARTTWPRSSSRTPAAA